MGLQDTHSYTITNLNPGNDVTPALISMKNPNSNALEWKGNYSDDNEDGEFHFCCLFLPHKKWTDVARLKTLPARIRL